MDFIIAILSSWGQLALWMAGFFLVFGLLARWMPCNPGQKLSRRDIVTDTLYILALSVLNRLGRIGFIGIGVFIVFYGESPENINEFLTRGYGPLGALPIWLQAALVFFISDIALYWIHRLFHQRRMWRYHAIHHSPTTVDWHSAFRFHPINTWLSSALIDAVMLLIGFSPASVATMASFNLIYSAMVHANLNWTFGPFKYLFASPVFHRWHHTAQEEGMDKNFAPTFPLLDIVFGTFYMPEDRYPEHYGVPEVPHGFLRQMIWPFKEN